MVIYLIGNMASGKTTLGKKLASMLHFEFIDTDNEIEKREENTIDELFELHGEEYFRELEYNLIEEIGRRKSDHLVIATGGGLPCFNDLISVLNNTGITIFLNVAEEIAVSRLKESEKWKRPLLQSYASESQLKGKLEEINRNRIKYYSQAKITIGVKNEMSPDQVVEAIMQSLSAYR